MKASTVCPLWQTAVGCLHGVQLYSRSSKSMFGVWAQLELVIDVTFFSAV